MSLEILGLITICVGFALLGAPVVWTVLAMSVSTVFGVTAAIDLPSIGSSILLPNLFLVFFIVRIYIAVGEGPVLAAVSPTKPGFWLLVLTIFAVLSAFFLPRLLAGTTITMTFLRSVGGNNLIAQVPLTTTSSNITQSVYAVGGLFCFAFAYAYAQRLGSAQQIMRIFLVVGAINIFFAVMDIVTYYSNTAHLMDFIRTANYALLTGHEKAGFKRIAGTFSEAAAFSNFSLVIFALAASLWLDKSSVRAAGAIALIMLIMLVLSTSATALVGTAVMCSFLWIRTFFSSMSMPEFSRTAFLVVGSMLAVFLLLSVPVFFVDFALEVFDYLQETLLSKLDSASGRERFRWNASAFQNFLDTGGLGTGLGSVRASSFVLVLLSNVGVIGTLLFAIFAASFLFAKSGWSVEATDVQLDRARVVRAAKAGFFAVLVSQSTSGTVYDLGLLFYLLGGLGSAFCYSNYSQAASPGELRPGHTHSSKFIPDVSNLRSSDR